MSVASDRRRQADSRPAAAGRLAGVCAPTSLAHGRVGKSLDAGPFTAALFGPIPGISPKRHVRPSVRASNALRQDSAVASRPAVCASTPVARSARRPGLINAGTTVAAAIDETEPEFANCTLPSYARQPIPLGASFLWPAGTIRTCRRGQARGTYSGFPQPRFPNIGEKREFLVDSGGGGPAPRLIEDARGIYRSQEPTQIGDLR